MEHRPDRMLILIVDDDEELVLLISSLLLSRGYEVDAAMTGKDAIQRLDNKPNLVLLDRMLPDGDGLEVCSTIRENPKYNHIPIIILSALDETVEKVKGLRYGADDYVTKPFDREELLARIRAAMRRQHFMKQDRKEIELFIDEVKKIIKNKLITPFYQPIFSSDALQPIGLELLSRPPANSTVINTEIMFEAAASFGLYLELEKLCWERGISNWNEQINKGRLFLNCSPKFIEKRILDDQILSSRTINPENIVLELTECFSVKNHALFCDQLKTYRDKGVKVSIDDFGGGSANYNIVEAINPDYLKIDRMLIHQVHLDPLKKGIVKSIIDFCKKSEISSIAEGVEEVEEYKHVFDLGIDAMQGNLFATAKEDIDTKFSYKN